MCVHRPLAEQAEGRAEGWGALLPAPLFSSAGSEESGNATLRAGLQGVMKVCLSREENRTYFISHFVSLIYNLQIFRHMVCEPPSVLLLSPTNPCHLLPTLNTECLLSPSSVLRPGTPGVESTIPAPKRNHPHGIKPLAPKTVRSPRPRGKGVGLVYGSVPKP